MLTLFDFYYWVSVVRNIVLRVMLSENSGCKKLKLVILNFGFLIGMNISKLVIVIEMVLMNVVCLGD